ncbi:hypothetical protein TWF730_005926 [Orbilia blumenaviensis]|uniref:F-box domain-containing protein n=1 Tax=Orbilia blumenaviensis TaxID=1796055 RepID=A0AAV9VJT8_9PEZI
MTITNNVFQLPEILEAILLRVPPVTVNTTCRLICKHWYNVIEGTPAMRHYTSTGLWFPDRERGVDQLVQQLPEPFNAFTPMSLDLLQIYWRKLDAIAIKSPDPRPSFGEDSLEYEVMKPTRIPLLQKIYALLAQFQCICKHVQLLRPEFSFIKYKKFSKNWTARVYTSAEEIQAIKDTPSEQDPNPLIEIMRQMGLSIWNATKSDAYDYNPDGIIPKHEDGEVKAYLLFIVDYKAIGTDIRIEETKRKDTEELLRLQDRKRIKSIIRARSLALVQEGYRPLDDDTDEDVWEEEEKFAHERYEQQEGTKVFRELLRFGDYAPHRPVVVIRGTNYGYTD